MADKMDDLASEMKLIGINKGTGDDLKYERLDSFKFDDNNIGSGAFGKVFKAHHPTYNDVAIKMLKSRDEAEREATQMKKLQLYSCQIIHVLCLVTDNDKFGIVMEWMTLGSLRSFQQRVKHIPWALRMRMLKDIAEGMYFLHHQKPPIVHGDLKAENIFVNEKLVVKIGDLGLSRSMASVMDVPDKAGTPTHMPPEYFTTFSTRNVKWDVYSFAILQYEIGSGEEVYKDVDKGRLEKNIVKGIRLPIEDLPKDTPSVVKELIEECWKHEPDKRPDFENIKTRIQQVYSNVFWKLIHEAYRICQEQLSQEQIDIRPKNKKPVTDTDEQDSQGPHSIRGSETHGSAETKPSTTPTVKNGTRPIDVDVIFCIKRKLKPENFTDFGNVLGLSDDISTIKYDYDRYGFQEQVYQLISKWKQKFGAPTVNDIAKCLSKIDRVDIIHELNKLPIV
ncbi:receptor-interacting serine/threonine-protein kinase 3-like [Antedon mediterranea]|uniref:receptor-interacting serine/threonine-protein kinase 3-like n=1 Tax=Antedon mediterranea TaxID=105859 RepID=UPI003AF4AE08